VGAPDDPGHSQALNGIDAALEPDKVKRLRDRLDAVRPNKVTLDFPGNPDNIL
jgi:hypothetical protein